MENTNDGIGFEHDTGQSHVHPEDLAIVTDELKTKNSTVIGGVLHDSKHKEILFINSGKIPHAKFVKSCVEVTYKILYTPNHTPIAYNVKIIGKC